MNKEVGRNGWIPCSERLPDGKEEVLLYLTHKEDTTVFEFMVGWCEEIYKEIPHTFDELLQIAMLNISNVEALDLLAYPTGEFMFETGYGDYATSKQQYEKENCFEGYVLAWMPLPEPYKEGDEE